MPVLLLRLTPTATGEIKILLDRNIKAQKVVLSKICIVKNATNNAETFISIELPQIFHECHTNSKRGCFCVALDKDSKFENLDFHLSFGIENLSTTLNAKLYDYQGNLLTTSSHIKMLFIYLDYQTNELF
jgi:hypothetical protein